MFPHHALRELKALHYLFPIAFHFAWSDTKARYRRSTLGPLWLVIGTAIGTIGIGTLWGSLLKEDLNHFLPSLTIGLVVWQLISGALLESPSAFIRHTGTIRNLCLPRIFFPIQVLFKQWINFFHNLLVLAIVFFWFNIQPFKWQVALSLILLFLTLFGLITCIAIIGTRFRDLEPLLGAMMPLIFFLSPVLYRPDQLGVRAALAWINPFSYLIIPLRNSLLDLPLPSFVWFYAWALCIGACILALWLLQKTYHRLPFWL